MNANTPNPSSAKRSQEALRRAEQVTLTDFSTALSAGILAAIEARERPAPGGIDWRPWVWAGWMIGDGPWGPFGPDGPGVGGGPPA